MFIPQVELTGDPVVSPAIDVNPRMLPAMELQRTRTWIGGYRFLVVMQRTNLNPVWDVIRVHPSKTDRTA